MLDKFAKKEAPIQGIAGLGGGVVRVASSGGESYWITYTRRNNDYDLYAHGLDVDSSGNTYATATDTWSSGFGHIFSLDNKGVVRWAYRVRDPNVGTGSHIRDVQVDPSANGYAITQAYMRSNDAIVAFDTSDGSLEIRQSSGTASTGFDNNSPMAVDSSSTYVLGRAGGGEYAYLYKFSNSDGSNTWTYRMYSGQYNVNADVWGVFLDTQSSGTFIMYKMSSGSYEGVHVTKVNASGGLVNWLGGSNNTAKFNGGRYFYPYGGAVDSSGNMYVCGGYLGSGWAPRLIKLSTSGSILWQRYASSSSGIILGPICTDSEDNVYVAQRSTSRFLIWKWNSSGTLQWERGLRTSNSSTFSCEKLVCDANDNIYLYGYTEVTPSTQKHAVIAKFKADGSITGTYSPFVWESNPVNQSWDTSSLMTVSAENYSSRWAANSQYSWSENTDIQQTDYDNYNLLDTTVNT
tara:strand:- start:69 stop:1454 length:1386 start_codon:yes stop_codon:yes gene_type:complete